jgi:tetratricopeptide (TPR) repeat protein
MIYYFNGLANSRQRNFDEAIQSLEQGKRMAGSNPALKCEINSLLGDAYHARKDYDKSDIAYDEALAFNPGNEAVLNNYSYYLALRKSNLEKAEKMSSQLVKSHPDNATYLDTHAWVLFSRQKYKEARKAIEKAINTGQANATHFEHYGDILYKLGDVDDAVKQWEKARGMLGSGSELLNKKISNRKIYE